MSLPAIADMLTTARPLIFGHRGAKAYAPMNTLPAFELALRQGAHGIELDVHRSRDGQPVIVHDFTVDATTDGNGLVTSLTLAELKALDAGAWFGPQWAGIRIPTLDEVFEALGQRLLINVEIKAMGAASDGVEEVVAACIRRHNLAQRVIVSSFNLPTLHRFRACMPEVLVGYLYEEPKQSALVEEAFDAIHPHYSLVDAHLVAAAHAAGKLVNVWTVNEPQQVIALMRLGVDSIITDAPDVALAALG